MFEQSEHAGTRSRLSPYALVIAMALTWAAAALAHRVFAGPLGAELVAAMVTIPLFGWALTRVQIGPKRMTFLAIASLPVGMMLISCFLAPARFPAIFGEPPLWQGWMLWATALGWLWITTTAADGTDLLAIVRFLAIAGSITACWAMLERFGVIPTYDSFAGPAMAFFDNSQSMGQVLVITIAATVGLAVRKGESVPVRALLWALVAVQFSAIVVAQARSAAVAVAFGVLAYGALEARRTGIWRWIRLASIAGLVLFVATFALVCAVWSGAFGHPAFDRADALLSGRLTLWSHVGEEMAGDVALGTAPSRFESFTQWTVLPDGRLDLWTTHDQHSILLTWLMDAGVLGFLLLGFAVLSMALLVLRSVAYARSVHSARILAAGSAAAFVVMLSSWPEPIAVLSVTAIAGSVIANGAFAHLQAPRPFPARSPILIAPVAVACFAAAVTIWAVFPCARQQLATANAHSAPELMRVLDREIATTHDVTYLENKLFVLNAAGSAAGPDAQTIELLRRLAHSYPPGAEGSVELPYYGLEILWAHSDDLSADECWALSRLYAEKGDAADAGTGVWDYALARAAVTTGRPNANVYIDRAIQSDPPRQALDVLMGWKR